MEELHLRSLSALHKAAFTDSLLSDRGLRAPADLPASICKAKAEQVIYSSTASPYPLAKTGLREAHREILGLLVPWAPPAWKHGELSQESQTSISIFLPIYCEIGCEMPAFVYLFLRQPCSVALAGLEPDVQTAESSNSAVRLLGDKAVAQESK